MKKEYKKIQDNDSHWYWIPTEKLNEFEEWNNMDTETDDFDPSKYDEFRTYGDPDNAPAYWKNHKTNS
jgi:hypothetical protein